MPMTTFGGDGKAPSIARQTTDAVKTEDPTMTEDQQTTTEAQQMTNAERYKDVSLTDEPDSFEEIFGGSEE